MQSFGPTPLLKRQKLWLNTKPTAAVTALHSVALECSLSSLKSIIFPKRFEKFRLFTIYVGMIKHLFFIRKLQYIIYITKPKQWFRFFFNCLNTHKDCWSTIYEVVKTCSQCISCEYQVKVLCCTDFLQSCEYNTLLCTFPGCRVQAQDNVEYDANVLQTLTHRRQDWV